MSREADERVEQARRERERIEPLARDGVVSQQSLDQAKNMEATSANEMAAARYKADAAASEVRAARAGLIAIDSKRSESQGEVALSRPRARAEGG